MSYNDIRKEFGLGADTLIRKTEEKAETGYAAVRKEFGLDKLQTEQRKPVRDGASSRRVYEKRQQDLTGGYDPVTNREAGQAGWDAYVAQGKKLAENTKEAEEKPLWEKILGYLGDAGPDTSLPLNVDTNKIAKGYQEQDNKMKTPDDRWTEDQKLTFGYLWNSERQKAYEYAYAVNNALNEQEEQQQAQSYQQAATDTFSGGVGHTVGAILTAPIGGIADAMGDMIAMGATGHLPGADGELSPHEYSEAVKGGVAEHLNKKSGTISENIPIIGGKGLGDVYSLGTSIAQSLLSAHTGGASQALISSFGTAVASGIDDAKSRGAEDNKAITYGVLTGTAEAFAEMIGVDNLMKLGAADSMKALLKNILKQGTAESLEEGLTSVLNNFADNLVLADKSRLNMSIQAYMDTGMTEAEAQRYAWLDMAEDVAFDMLGGFVSGSASGGIETGIRTVSAKPGTVEWVQELIEQGRTANDTKQVQTGEQAMQAVIDEVLSNGTVADPVSAAVEAFKESSTVTNKQAMDILNNPKALQTLREQVGLELPDTASGRRNAIKEAVEKLAQQKAENNNVQPSNANERSGVKEQLRSKQDELNTMQPAAEIQAPTEFAKMDKAGKQNWVVEKLRSTGYKVDRKGFGIIDFAKKRLKAAFKYFDSGSAEEAAFEALPYVLENGIEISSHSDHKGRTYRTVTIAAPVIINGKRGNMAVVVKQTDGNHYKVHRILTPDGSVFQLSETTNEADRADGGVTENGSLATSNGAASLETGVRGSTLDHGQTHSLIPASDVSISENEQSVNDESRDPKAAEVLTDTPKTEKARRGLWSWVKEDVFDKGMVFEDLALKTKNRELQAKWNSTRYAQPRAQWLIGNGANNTKSLSAIRQEVEKTGKAKQFAEYLYHKHNIDRMQLQTRYKGAKNKPVFGDAVTANVSQGYVEQYEKENPAFVQLAEDVYAYMNHLRQLMVDNGVISQDTANLWAEMYPHYVPIHRAEKDGRSVSVPLDTGRTGANAPVKKAKGGSTDILPLFDTIAQRTLQTYTAIARNSFGVELKNTLGSVVSKNAPDVDDVIDSVEAPDALLQEGKNGTNPTFTVFENGKRVTFEITKEMYDALKPKSEVMSYTNKVSNAINNFRRGVLTEYNPTFMLTNAIKDVQDVLINSQHPAKTYAKIPQAYAELAKKGKWYSEYLANGGEQNTYFDSETNTFETEDAGLKKLLAAPPLGTISKLNSFIEMAPRLAEYIASREAGRSIDLSMLDAARVTTNFAAGGDLTKLLDRNGATFLNASVQGAVQQARNFREATTNGWKGWAVLAARFALAGLPEMLLNGLIWEDDEDYEELSDYVKDNYYIVWKYGDGQFVKIPKGRVAAVIQGALRQMQNAITGDDQVDLSRFLDLLVSNLAPNNPMDSNILSPIIQASNNETWYGEDLVPSRLQGLPAAEQYDESTDALSKWLGEKLNISPVKINYLLNQYGGGIADTFLPMLTPEAESGDDSLAGNLLAPLRDKFTTDSVMNNQDVTDFYDKLDELTTNAKAGGATVEDQILYKYINSVNAKLRDLYAEKREAQSNNLPDDQKYAQVRRIQQKITEAAKQALEACEHPYSADKAGMVAGVIGDSITDLTDYWKRGADTTAAADAIDKAYDAYTKMDNTGKEGVKAEGGRAADYLTAKDSGISTKTFVDLYKTYYSIDNSGGNTSAKASKWSYELEKAREDGTITAAQKHVLKENMNFWQMIPAETERFDALMDSGLSADKSSYITEILDSLFAEAGSSTVRTIQKVEAIAGADDKLTEEDQKAAMQSVLDDKGYAKYLKVLALGIDTDDFATSYRLYLDAEGNDQKKRTIAQYQKDLKITYTTAKKLYEIYNPPRS